MSGGCATRSASPNSKPGAGKRQLGSGPGRPGPGHAARPGSQRGEAGTGGAARAPPLPLGGRPGGPAAPSHRLRGGQLAGGAGARGQVSAPGDAPEAPVRPGSTGSPRCWGGGERAPSTPRPLSRVPLKPGRTAPGPASAVTPAPAAAQVPEPTPSAAPPPGPARTAGARGAAGSGDRPRPLGAQLRLPSRGALGPAGAAPRVTCKEPERRPHLPGGRGKSGGYGRLPRAGQGEGPRAPRPRPPPRSPPRGARAARSPARPAAPHARGRPPHIPRRLGPPPPRGHWLHLPSLSRAPPVPLELIGGRAGDVRPVGASRGAGSRQGLRGGLGARGGSGVLGADPRAGHGRREGGWRGRPQAAGCGGRRGLIGASSLSLAALEPVPGLSGAPCAAGGARRRGAAASLQERELDRSDPDARLLPAWEELFRVCVSTFCISGKTR